MINTLARLINDLYPDPQYGILTLKSNIIRVPLVRTPEAVVAIAEAQRLNRADNYDLSGLCEFHVGIIYAHWDDFAGAEQQFALARQQWLFADQRTPIHLTHFTAGYTLESKFTRAVCLTHFAKGYSQEKVFAYGKAISAYRKAKQCLQKTEQCLPQIMNIEPDPENPDIFLQEIRRCTFIDKLNKILTKRVAYTHKQLFATLKPNKATPQQPSQ